MTCLAGQDSSIWWFFKASCMCSSCIGLLWKLGSQTLIRKRYATNAENGFPHLLACRVREAQCHNMMWNALTAVNLLPIQREHQHHMKRAVMPHDRLAHNNT